MAINKINYDSLSCGLEPDAVRMVGPRAELTAVFTVDALEGCRPSFPDQGPSYAYYEPGPPVPPDEFPLVVERVE